MSKRTEAAEGEIVDRLVHINRVAKVVKGGRRFGFAALVVAGDQRGKVGFGRGKAREVPEAIRKATEVAKRSMIRVPLREGRTLHHDVLGSSGAGRALLRAAPPGTGIIAGGPMRAVFDALGAQDIVAKSLGSSNPNNMVRAVFDALKKQASPRMVAARRGMKVSDVLVGRPRMKRGKQTPESETPASKTQASKTQGKKAAPASAKKKDAKKKDAKKGAEKKGKEKSVKKATASAKKDAKAKAAKKTKEAKK